MALSNRRVGLLVILTSVFTLAPMTAEAQPASPRNRSATAARSNCARHAGNSNVEVCGANRVKEDGLIYKFKDDRLLGGSVDGRLPRIRVRARPVRRTLLRLRLHFVPELLKSVEIL